VTAAKVFNIRPEGEAPQYSRREMVPSFDEPMKVAAKLRDEWADDGEPLLWWRGDWWRWTGTYWTTSSRDEVDARIRHRLVNAWCERTSYGATGSEAWDEPWRPNNRRVDETIGALRAHTLLSPSVEEGSDRKTGRPVRGRVATSGGVLNLATREIEPSDPQWFTTWALPYSLAPETTRPERWLRFLDDLWGDDETPKLLLQEWMGYLVSGDTDQHKGMLLIGEKRGGKGTILNVCAQLVGLRNVSGPTLASMTKNFGLQNSIGKALIAVGDARLDGVRSTATLVERLLSITAHDPLMIDRKNKEPWDGKLGARIMIASNEVPDFRDASGALPSRWLTLRMTRSFLGKEDLGLGDALTAEMPSILAWALDGLDRLRERVRFDTAMSDQVITGQMAAAASPIKLFAEQACKVHPDAWISKDLLFDCWSAWCTRYNRARSSPETMARALLAACADVQAVRPRVGGRRVQRYAGISIDPVWLAELHGHVSGWDTQAEVKRLQDRVHEESRAGDDPF
jgi:putative DNA primase/helicase